MIWNKRLVDRIRDGDSISTLLALALSAMTPIQRLGMAARRLQRVHRVNARVISFGNITAGGTGKTPAVIERVRQEMEAGRRVAVLTRGYAAPSGSTPYDSTNLGGLSPYVALGDEAALILQKVPGVTIVKNADRVAGAHRAIALGCDTLILDDGFQSLRLARDEDIVLVDATNPFGNGRLIPRGILREPPSALARATHIIITHTDAAADLNALQSRLKSLAPNATFRKTRHTPIAVRHLATGQQEPLDWLRGRELQLASAIASPDRFRKAVEALGANPTKIASARDHAPLDAALAELSGIILITEKDSIRISKPASNIYTLEIELRDLD